MKTLSLTDYSWDSNNEISFNSVYEDWFNKYGNRDLMEVVIKDLKFNESLNITLSIDDMVELQEFLKDRINEAKASKFYDDI